MLVGSYEHNIDGKNRVFVPSKFREEMGDEYIYKIFISKYPSIQLFKKSDYERIFPELDVDSGNTIQDRRERQRRSMGTGEVSCDSQGRIVLSPFIAKMAKLQKNCVFVGFETYVEIYSPEVYEAYFISLAEDYAAEEEAFENEERINREYRSKGAYLDVNKDGEI